MRGPFPNDVNVPHEHACRTDIQTFLGSARLPDQTFYYIRTLVLLLSFYPHQLALKSQKLNTLNKTQHTQQNFQLQINHHV